MGMEDLIRGLAGVERMLFVVGGGSCVSEMYCDGRTEPEFHGGWGMIESGPWHLHLDMGSIAQAQFVEAEDHGAPVLYYVRFSDEAGETLLRAYFPSPYLNEDEELVEFQPSKLAAFEEMRDRFVNGEDVVFVRRPKGG